MSIFPFIQPRAQSSENTGMPLYREIKWDYEKNVPVFSGGEPVLITGGPAVAVWAWKALHCQRYLFEIYTTQYGNELETLIGQPYTEKVKMSEAGRYVRECLLINPYITGVDNVSVDFADGTLYIKATLKTIYGEETVDVRI